MSNNNLPDLTEIVDEILGPYENLVIPSGGISELLNWSQNVERPIDRSRCDQCKFQLATMFSTACNGHCHLCPGCYSKGRRQYNRNVCIKCNQRSYFRHFEKIREPTEVNTCQSSGRARCSTVEDYDRNTKQRLLDNKKTLR